MKKRVTIFSVLLALTIVGQLLAGEPQEIFRKTVPLKGISQIRVRTTNGTIHVQGNAQLKDEVRVTAYVKGEEGFDPGKVNIVVEPKNGVLQIDVEKLSKKKGGLLSWLLKFSSYDWQVDFELEIPRDMNLNAYSTNGNIQVLNVYGGIEAYTTNGEIECLNVCQVRNITSTNGSINVVFEKIPQHGQMDVSTTNGKIRAILPENTICNIDAFTSNGQIDCQLPQQFSTFNSPHHLKLRSSSGKAPTLSLKTTNGNISIQQQ